MAFLDWFSSTTRPDSWRTLETAADVEQAIQQAQKQPVAFFKHSTRCGTSHQLMDQLVKDTQNSPGGIAFYYLDLIVHRSLSNQIAEILNVAHQSPQLILFYKDEVVAHASHHAIDWAKMTANLPAISS